MTLRSKFVATSFARIILATSSLAFAQNSTTPVKTGYAPVNGSSFTTKFAGPENL